MTRRAYTMAELLVVIAIIAIISGIIVLSLGRVGASRQRDQTVILLERLKNALTEITNSPSGAQKLYTVQLPAIYFPPKTTTDFDFPNSDYKQWVGVPPNAIESHYRSMRVINEILAGNPAAKKILDDLPLERRAKVKVGAPLAPAGVTKEFLVPLDSWGKPILFVFDNLQIATGTNVGRAFTVDLGSATQVEVGGLMNVFTDLDKNYWEGAVPLTTKTPTYNSTGVTNLPYDPVVYVRPITYTQRFSPTGTNEITVRSPDHRPFFMSAGPDGKYETFDDNVFSFGN